MANIISQHRRPEEFDLDVYQELLKAHALCVSLFAAGVTGGGSGSNRTYGTFLRRAKKLSNETFLEGLRLQAAVNLVSAAVVDKPVLAMAAHSALEHDAWSYSRQHNTRIISKRVLLEEFPINNPPVFREHVRAIWSFLLAPPLDGSHGFWEGRVTVEKATEVSMKIIAETTAADPAHITHSNVDYETRERHLNSILNDPIMGRLYRLCTRLVVSERMRRL
jgi:hypothetical protein